MFIKALLSFILKHVEGLLCHSFATFLVI